MPLALSTPISLHYNNINDPNWPVSPPKLLSVSRRPAQSLGDSAPWMDTADHPAGREPKGSHEKGEGGKRKENGGRAGKLDERIGLLFLNEAANGLI